MRFSATLNQIVNSSIQRPGISGKMKMQLEKPTVNISKLTGGKNEKPRRGTLHEKIDSSNQKNK